VLDEIGSTTTYSCVDDLADIDDLRTACANESPSSLGNSSAESTGQFCFLWAQRDAGFTDSSDDVQSLEHQRRLGVRHRRWRTSDQCGHLQRRRSQRAGPLVWGRCGWVSEQSADDGISDPSGQRDAIVGRRRDSSDRLIPTEAS
jgi:hypothetical protein